MERQTQQPPGCVLCPYTPVTGTRKPRSEETIERERERVHHGGVFRDGVVWCCCVRVIANARASSATTLSPGTIELREGMGRGRAGGDMTA